MKKLVEKWKRILTEKVICDIIKYQKLQSHFGMLNIPNEGGLKTTMTIEILANSLIQEFIKVRINGRKINCTRTKIGKLLTLIQILSLKMTGNLAFEDEIMEETCGTSIPVLTALRYPYNIWGTESESGDLNSDEISLERNSKIDNSEIRIVDEPIPNKYVTVGILDEVYKNIIKDVFLEFGLYESYELGTLISQFKSEICCNGVVQKDKICDWLNHIPEHPNNPVVDFIRKY